MQRPRMVPGPVKRQKVASRKLLSEGTPSEVLTFEAEALLGQHRKQANAELSEQGTGQAPEQYIPPAAQTELELEIEQLSSTGDGLACSAHKNHVYVVPFSIPGDRVLAKTFPQRPNPLFTQLDFVKVLRPSPKREGVTPGCQYFGVCSGCQLQMMPYEEQLKHKKTIVEKAFKYFSNLDPSRIPPIGDTVGSPLQYGYRTKLTPHYDKPAKKADASLPAIGFGLKNSRRVLDIEQCPIGTPILNEGLAIERRKVHETFSKRKTGATVLLRESTQRKPISGADLPETAAAAAEKQQTAKETSPPPSSRSLTLPVPTPRSEQHRVKDGLPQIIYTYDTYQDVKTYTSTGTAWTTEHVGEFKFESRANSFFQNNNSILPSFIRYVREHCVRPENTDHTPHDDNDRKATPADAGAVPRPPIKYLLDAYCGSGLFAVCLSPLFASVLGIDIDVQGVEAARHNATANAIPNAGFIAADAECLFADVPFPPDQTLVVIDPPRKGASVDFLRQLCAFGPRRVVYVSCNVHTQARDVGLLVSGFDDADAAWRYEIESLRGFDFFPQTGHVEGVCFLTRVPNHVTVTAPNGDGNGGAGNRTSENENVTVANAGTTSTVENAEDADLARA
ncbi:hypothetical protein A1O3_05047 [Capronia epimyces CBS 606.96]|uniref:TRAM domain-containing protein n=1 Tax=Capronia epimyces CBS 606.96 TaxID=1182542 RepID=W9Y430_9EURO|nr:uncharacterized protein A1O3_05047 [Capronia epimyces CBS 606.96]EXJ84380.1 hypothetical protein A1O3_05047 [Capronia epimyces CBS 606.96]